MCSLEHMFWVVWTAHTHRQRLECSIIEWTVEEYSDRSPERRENQKMKKVAAPLTSTITRDQKLCFLILSSSNKGNPIENNLLVNMWGRTLLWIWKLFSPWTLTLSQHNWCHMTHLRVKKIYGRILPKQNWYNANLLVKLIQPTYDVTVWDRFHTLCTFSEIREVDRDDNLPRETERGIIT